MRRGYLRCFVFLAVITRANEVNATQVKTSVKTDKIEEEMIVEASPTSEKVGAPSEREPSMEEGAFVPPLTLPPQEMLSKSGSENSTEKRDEKSGMRAKADPRAASDAQREGHFDATEKSETDASSESTSVLKKESQDESGNVQAEAKEPAAKSSSASSAESSGDLFANLGSTSSASDSLWNSISIICLFTAGLGISAYFIARLKGKKGFGIEKIEKQMQVLSAMPISPKRQILLVKIKDREIALASTESGIQFLLDVSSKAHVTENFQRREIAEERPKSIPAFSQGETQRVAERAPDPKPKSDIIRDALKKIRTTGETKQETETVTAAPKIKQKPQQAPEEQFDEGNPSEHEGERQKNARAAPAMQQSRGAFPKYLANAFESEQKRDLTRPQPEDSVESVTNMIREKLKSMQKVG
jgi:flagellar biogenesis protein FliO